MPEWPVSQTNLTGIDKTSYNIVYYRFADFVRA